MPTRRLIICGTFSALCGCSNIEKPPPRPEPVRADRSIDLDVPQIMRGTVASECIVLGYTPSGAPGYQPVIVRGYGLVVGLNGTGSRDIPPQVRAHMLAEAARGGFGSERFGSQIANISPEELLDSPDTAVVIVEAIVPQGAVEATRFDVRVYADPRTGTTSLEGGRLYTTQLRPGPLRTGSTQAFELAEASGPIFVNPFVEPAALGQDSVVRTAGRILDGGVVVKDMPLKLRLAHPSHARASVIQNAINTRFPQEPGQHDPTARGESEEQIQLTVPPSYADRTDEFIELVRHTTIRQTNPEAVAMSVHRLLLADPIVANAALLRWQALGTRVQPIIKDLYDYPEERPRLAALHAGARLDDPLAIPHLVDAARSGSTEARLEAIRLLGDMRMNPLIDQALRSLLNDEDVEVRLGAYEALVQRRDPYLRRYDIDGKFVLDIVDSDQSMVYVSQSGRPRIVLFGQDLELKRPLTLQAWSNRLMIKADGSDSDVEVYYRRPNEVEGLILRVAPDLEGFIRFLGHTTSVGDPAPGLGLSYGETVGALHQIWRQNYIEADFKAEQDRILAAILRLSREAAVVERPEFSGLGAPLEAPQEDQTNSATESLPDQE